MGQERGAGKNVIKRWEAGKNVRRCGAERNVRRAGRKEYKERVQERMDIKRGGAGWYEVGEGLAWFVVGNLW
jgi:hypothetical protein